MKRTVNFEVDLSPLYKELMMIRKRPAMYIGEKNLMTLNHYILGFRMGLRASQTKSLEVPPFSLFDSWLRLQIKSKKTSLNCSWAKLLCILHRNRSVALDRFYEYFEKFLTLKVISAEILSDHQNNRVMATVWNPGKMPIIYRINKMNEIIDSYVPNSDHHNLLQNAQLNWNYKESHKKVVLKGQTLQKMVKKIYYFEATLN